MWDITKMQVDPTTLPPPETLRAIMYSLVTVLALLLSATFFLLATSPTQWNPYNPDLIELTQEEKDKQRTMTKEELYAHFNLPENVKVNMQRDLSVQVLVLGDIGRSPRMQYHALSLAKHGGKVDIIGFAESEIHPELQRAGNVKIVPLLPPPAILQTSSKLLFVLLAPLKVIWQTFNLYHTLSYKVQPAQWLLVQNPPSIPVLAVAKLVCIFRNTKLIIDWHNFGWSILALKLGRNHPLVLIAKAYEQLMSRTATAHFAVTAAMSRMMRTKMGVNALPLHDRPAAIFKSLDASERSKVLRRLEQTAAHTKELERGSWRLLVSSTSWTADEDFSLLLDALVGYSEKAAQDKSLPYILAVITGKGPQKEHYLKKIKDLSQAKKLSKASIVTAWLSAEDYAALLGAADLGVSLHMSSSGVDLPMKVVDMFGAGLPVVGWSKYESWPELVKEGVNGRGFGSAQELERLLVELFSGEAKHLENLKKGALREGLKRWDDEWNAVAGKEVFRL